MPTLTTRVPKHGSRVMNPIVRNGIPTRFAARPSKTPAPTPAESEPPAATVPVPSYDSETLSDLLVAEVAAQRQSLGVTLGYYSQAARETRDPQVISQAAQLAHYLEDHQQTLALSELWLEQAPTNEEALQLAILSEIRLDNIDTASRYLDTLLGAHGADALGRLVNQARGLDAQGNRQLVQALAQLTDRYPDQAPLWYARALWLEHEGNYSGALQADERALHLMPRHEDALLLKAQLLHKLGEEKKALRHLKKLVRKYPEARRPRITYIRMLLAAGETKTVRFTVSAKDLAFVGEDGKWITESGDFEIWIGDQKTSIRYDQNTSGTR